MIDIDFKDNMPVVTVLIDNETDTQEYQLKFERLGPDRVDVTLHNCLGICFREILDTRPNDD